MTLRDMHMRICFFGDSIVNGTGDPDCLGWVGRVCAAARQGGVDLTSYNLGIRRDASADILGRWRREAELRLPAEHPRRLVFSFGVNDCIQENGACRVPGAQTISNARAILGTAAAYAPTKLVQLSQSKTLCMLNYHYRGIGNVNSDFDYGSGHENVQFTFLE